MRHLGRSLGWLVGSVLRIRRDHARRSLERAGINDSSRVAKGVYASLGTTVFELLWAAGRPAHASAALVQIQGWNEVERALAQGRGLVVATAHTGNWDLAGCAVASKVSFSVVTKHMSWRSLDRFWQTLRARRGVDLVDAQGTMQRAQAHLAANGAVAFMIDQAPMRASGIERGPFLGHPAEHDASFALLAARCHAPVVFAFPRRRADGTHEVQVRGVVFPPPRPTRSWVRQTTLRAADALATFVCEEPEQWLWLHRRWKRRHEALAGQIEDRRHRSLEVATDRTNEVARGRDSGDPWSHQAGKAT